MRLLIISPHFPPTNAADMHRVRLILPYLREQGVEAEVLAVDADSVAAPRDEWLCEGLPDDLVVHRVRGLGLRWARVPGMGLLANRTYLALRQRAVELVRRGDFDLVYFSTTQFGVLSLGATLHERFGIPIVIDYQDPWVSDYYREHPQVTPPGGRCKYAVVNRLARYSEPRVLRHCAGVTSVSPHYVDDLRRRYSFLPGDWPTLVQPFPGDAGDLQRAAADPNVRQTIFDPHDGWEHWVSVGRGGQDLHRAARGLFLAMQRVFLQSESPAAERRVKLHFIGTSYAQAGAGVKSMEPLAREFGLEELVVESTDRIPYSSTLRCLLDAQALVVLGSDDTAYTASKLYSYLLARKPLLTVIHQDSPAVPFLQQVGGATLVPFRSEQSTEELAEIIIKRWCSLPARPSVPLQLDAFRAHTAAAQAESLARFFRSVVERVAEQVIR